MILIYFCWKIEETKNCMLLRKHKNKVLNYLQVRERERYKKCINAYTKIKAKVIYIYIWGNSLSLFYSESGKAFFFVSVFEMMCGAMFPVFHRLALSSWLFDAYTSREFVRIWFVSTRIDSTRPEIPCRVKMENINKFVYVDACLRLSGGLNIIQTEWNYLFFGWSDSHVGGSNIISSSYPNKILRCSKRNYLCYIHFFFCNWLRDVDLGCQVKIWSRFQSQSYIYIWLSTPNQANTSVAFK